MTINLAGAQISTNKFVNNDAVKPADTPRDIAYFNTNGDLFNSSDNNNIAVKNDSKIKKGLNFGLRALTIASITAAFSVFWNTIMNERLPSRKELSKLIPIGLAIFIPLGLVGALLLESRERGKKEANEQQRLNKTNNPSIS